MILFKQKAALRSFLKNEQEKGCTIGFVPTMGALHEGHLSLIRFSKEQHPITVCSIFINPTQFNDPKDFEKYPVTIEKDILLLTEAGCDVLFLPSVEEMYPPESPTNTKHYSLEHLETILEGYYRPGHFQGVCTIVHKLLDAVGPNTLYLGQKDYQQCMVIEQLITLEKIPVQIIKAPTQREPGGLAMSSRNMRLSEDGLQKATAIYASMRSAAENMVAGPTEKLIESIQNNLLDSGFERIDYISIANASTLAPISNWDGKEPIVILIAAYLEGVRLIDNLIINS